MQNVAERFNHFVDMANINLTNILHPFVSLKESFENRFFKIVDTVTAAT